MREVCPVLGRHLVLALLLLLLRRARLAGDGRRLVVLDLLLEPVQRGGPGPEARRAGLRPEHPSRQYKIESMGVMWPSLFYCIQMRFRLFLVKTPESP